MPGSLKTNLLLGVAAGLAGTAIMDAYFRLLKRLAPPSGSGSQDEEQTTEKVARAALRQVGVNKPDRDLLRTGGKAVHWTYGTAWGVIAGASRTAGLNLDWGGGQLLGLGLWAGGDMWMLYEMGFARHPREYPARTHLSALGAHLAYGLGVWATLEGLARVTERRRFHPRPVPLRRAA